MVHKYTFEVISLDKDLFASLLYLHPSQHTSYDFISFSLELQLKREIIDPINKLIKTKICSLTIIFISSFWMHTVYLS